MESRAKALATSTLLLKMDIVKMLPLLIYDPSPTKGVFQCCSLKAYWSASSLKDLNPKFNFLLLAIFDCLECVWCC